MAAYTELFDLSSDSDLRNRVAVACVVAAEVVMNETPLPNDAERKVWAANALNSPMAEAGRMLWAILGTNKDETVAAIQGASDASIQTNVEDHINLFADTA